MKDVMNLQRDYRKTDLFLGEEMGLFDTIHRPYPEIWQLYKDAIAQNWAEDEFDFTPCLKEFAQKDDVADIMTRVLMWQWEADSVVSHTLLPILAPFITNSELNAAMAFNTYMECCLHPDHEVYVKDKGWTYIKDCKNGEEVLQYDPDKEEVKFLPIVKVIAKPYDDEMYYLSNNLFKQVVTKDHELVVWTNFYKWNEYTLVEAQDFVPSEDTFFRLNSIGVECEKTWKETSPEQIYHIGGGISTDKVSVEKKSYKGMVYCLDTITGYFLTKYENSVTISKNCHAACYSEIIRNSFENPEQVILNAQKDQEVTNRLFVVSKALQELHDVGHRYALKEATKEEVFPILYKGLIAIYLLERLQFISSFSITFAIGEAGMYQPIANAVRKICSDEIQIHASVDMICLRELRKTKYYQLYKDNQQFQQECIDLVDDVIESELKFTDELFNGKSLVGVNADIIKEWVWFNAQIVKEELGMPFEVKVKENPIPWINNWLTLNKLQAAAQEIELSSYAVGTVNDDVDDLEIDF